MEVWWRCWRGREHVRAVLPCWKWVQYLTLIQVGESELVQIGWCPKMGRFRYGSNGGVTCVVLVVVFGLGLGKGVVLAVVPPTEIVVVFVGLLVAFLVLCPGWVWVLFECWSVVPWVLGLSLAWKVHPS